MTLLASHPFLPSHFLSPFCACTHDFAIVSIVVAVSGLNLTVMGTTGFRVSILPSVDIELNSISSMLPRYLNISD